MEGASRLALEGAEVSPGELVRRGGAPSARGAAYHAPEGSEGHRRPARLRAEGRGIASVFHAASRSTEAAVCDLRSGRACSQAQRQGRWPRHAERSTVGPRAAACSSLGAPYLTWKAWRHGRARWASPRSRVKRPLAALRGGRAASFPSRQAKPVVPVSKSSAGPRSDQSDDVVVHVLDGKMATSGTTSPARW
ncbi:hypothetical protein VPH35_138656 [Triticum aestivum]